MFRNGRTVLEMPADASGSAGGGTQSYGGFWIRFLAYLVDGIILFIALILLAVLAAFLGEIGAMLYGLLSFAGPFLYFAVLESSPRQATFGKQLVGLKVAHAATGERVSFLRALGRELAKIISGAILALGFIMAAFTGRKQGLHDFIASTVVVRDRPGNVLVAVILVVAGVVLPFFVLPLIMGLLVGVLGLGMFGALMDDAMKQPKKEPAPKPSISQPATKQPAKPRPPVSASPAPAAAPATQAITEAEYDRILAAPLSGIEKPSSARAGPAIAHFGTHFSDNFWLEFLVPSVPNLKRGRVSVTIDRVLDAKGANHYDRDSSFEGEFFRNVSLSESKSGVPHFSGHRSVRLTKGTTENDVHQVEGVLHLALPLDLKVVSAGSGDVGKELPVGPVKVTLKSFESDKVSFTVSGAAENFLGATGFDAQGAAVPANMSSQGGGSHTFSYRAPVARVELAAASGLLKREYPFSVTRGVTALSATSTAAPARPAAPEKPAAVALAPAKPAADKPAAVPAQPAAVEAKPAPPAKPAKPAAPEKPATVATAKPVAPGPAAVPAAPPAAQKPAQVRKAYAAPRPAPAATPTAGEKPRAVRRVAQRKPAVSEPAAAPVAPAMRTAKYNDVMTAVMYGDRAGAAEAIELGFWVDRPASNGMTALMAAALNGDAAMTQLLLKNGADPNRWGAGGSVLDHARSGGNNTVVELLRQAGAR